MSKGKGYGNYPAFYAKNAVRHAQRRQEKEREQKLTEIRQKTAERVMLSYIKALADKEVMEAEQINSVNDAVDAVAVKYRDDLSRWGEQLADAKLKELVFGDGQHVYFSMPITYHSMNRWVEQQMWAEQESGNLTGLFYAAALKEKCGYSIEKIQELWKTVREIYVSDTIKSGK